MALNGGSVNQDNVRFQVVRKAAKPRVSYERHVVEAVRDRHKRSVHGNCAVAGDRQLQVHGARGGVQSPLGVLRNPSRPPRGGNAQERSLSPRRYRIDVNYPDQHISLVLN